MPDNIPMPDQEAKTEFFLKTNGPPPNYFTPDVPAYALDGSSPREKYLLEMASISAKQNGWLIQETIGLKGAHRLIHSRLAEGDKKFEAIDEDRDKFHQWREKWLSRRKVVRNIIVAIITMLFLTFLPALVIEWIKHHFHWS
jgi:hypothetical protein